MTTLTFTMICGMLGLFEIKPRDKNHEGRLNKTFKGLVFICILLDILMVLWLCNKVN